MPHKLRHPLIACLLISATTGARAQTPYVLQTHVNEVALTFRAQDNLGRTLTDLQQSDLRILDNHHLVDRITLFAHHENLPLRIALLFDISPSMGGEVAPREVAARIAQTLIHSSSDQALLMLFDFETMLQQDWTSDPRLLLAATKSINSERGSRLGGTAIWDSLYRACRDHIPAQTPGDETFASAIILFTDGDDNRSHALPEDVVEECQQRQTAIYPFLSAKSSHYDKGQQALRSLAELTGGRVFDQQVLGSDISASALRIDTDLRDRYTVVYHPTDQKSDGKFHPIKLDAPHRTAFFTARTGYYATR